MDNTGENLNWSEEYQNGKAVSHRRDCRFIANSNSKLRFWEQQGLLQLSRNDENNYRQYSFLDMLRITDISFYRNLHFSTKELRQLFGLSAEELEKELEGKQTGIEQQLAVLHKTKQEIQIRRNHLQEAVRLQQ